MPDSTKADYAYEAALKKAILSYVKRPCGECGKLPTLADIAASCSLDKSGFWKFMNKPEATMMPSNLRRIEKFLQEQGANFKAPASSQK